MIERRTITETLQPFDDGGDEVWSAPISDVLKSLTECLEQIPEEHRHTAVLRVWGSGEYVSVYPEVRYSRPETDDEIHSRGTAAKRFQEESAARERAQYEKLKAKYG